jgi:hypothetical protein
MVIAAAMPASDETDASIRSAGATYVTRSHVTTSSKPILFYSYTQHIEIAKIYVGQTFISAMPFHAS